jgi:hypothetical protein
MDASAGNMKSVGLCHLQLLPCVRAGLGEWVRVSLLAVGRAGRGRAMRYRRGCTSPRQIVSRQQDGCHDGFLSRDTHQSDGSLEHKWRVGMRSPSRAEPRTNSMTYGVCFGEISVTLYRYMASDVDKLPR